MSRRATQDAQLRYILPHQAGEREVMEFRQAFFCAGENFIDGSARLESIADYKDWLAYCRRLTGARICGTARSVVCFAQREADGALVGIVYARNNTGSDHLLYGNIGYSVHPAQRGQGYATLMLRWALEQARELGAGKLFTCCYETNFASRRVMEKCGMRPEGYYDEEHTGQRVLRYMLRD